MWLQVDLSGAEPAAVGSPGALPRHLEGLSPATLADLSALAHGRPELQDRGWWPVTLVAEDLAQPRLVPAEKRAEARAPLSTRRLAMKAAAQAAFGARLAAGFAWGGKVAQIDPASQALIVAQSARASAAKAGDVAWPDYFAWRMADNSWLGMELPQDMLDFAEGAADYVLALRVRYWQIVDAIAAADSHADLDAVDLSAGWPAQGAVSGGAPG